jgi:predicted alpha/beta hydrolase family esterase
VFTNRQEITSEYRSEHSRSLGAYFRTSREHLEDVRRTIEFVNQKWHKPIFLIGHSAGTISVAHVAASLKDQVSEALF